MKKRTISVILLAAMILAASSCGKAEIPESGTQSVVTTEPEVTTDYLDTLPRTDMGGREFIILAEDRGANGIPNTHIGSESGDVMNDAVFRRDSAVEERYNIDIEYEIREKREIIVSDVSKSIMAGDESYHLIMSAMTFGSAVLTTSGMLYDLASLKELSLNADWWLPGCNERLYVGDSLYFAASPVAPTFFATPFGISFNKRIAADYKLPNLYDEVKNGTWTIDRMQELSKGVSQDINGDSIMDDKDVYGIATHSSALWGYYASSGITPLVIDKDNTYDLNLDSEKSVDIIEKLSRVLSDRKEVYYYDGTNTSHADLFKNGQALFADYSMTGFIITYRDMADDWGIIPIPKTDAEQEGYHTTLQTILPCSLSVPVNCSKPEETGLILETMAYLSDSGVRSAVYDVVLSGKVSRDEDSVAMLDIIYDDINIDLLYVYRFGSAPETVFASIAEGKPFVSAYESSRSMIESAIDTFLENVRKAEE